MMEQKRLL